jgi:anti-sigma B factor antagonist
LTVSNTGRTPAVSGHSSGADLTSNEDAVVEQVVRIAVDDDNQGTVVLRVSGEVDMLTTPVLSTELKKQFARRLVLLVLDLSGVEFLGSSGLAALVSAREEAGTREVPLRLVSADHAVLRPLTATGLAELFDIYPDLETALAGSSAVTPDDGQVPDA